MKMLQVVLRSAFVVLLVQGCGKIDHFDAIEPELKICDPNDNPGPCPANLRDDSRPARTLVVGNEGIGIRVDSPNNHTMTEACRSSKLNLLAKYIDNSAPYKGLFEGEFITNTSYEIVSQGSECTRRNVFKSCTRHLNFVRIICKFEIEFSPSIHSSQQRI